jgi:glutaredoxin
MTASRRRGWLVPLLLAVVVFVGLQWWTGRSQRAIGDELAAAARPGDIVMLSSEQCVYCTSARRWFEKHRVSFSECFIERDAACANAYQAQGAPGTPTLLVRGERQVGFNAERVALALASR